MSVYLIGRVVQSGLDPDLKLVAVLLADIASDDGTNIWPSVAYVAWLAGVSERTVQRRLRALEESGVLVAVERPIGGRRTVSYRLIEEAMPVRPAWRDRASDTGDGGVTRVTPRGDTGDGGVTRVTPRGDTGVTRSVSRSVSKIRNGSVRGDPPREARRSLPVDDAFIDELATEYDVQAGSVDDARELIGRAMNGKAYRGYADKRRGVRGWLNAHFKHQNGGKPNGQARGQARPAAGEASNIDWAAWHARNDARIEELYRIERLAEIERLAALSEPERQVELANERNEGVRLDLIAGLAERAAAAAATG